MLKSCGIKFVHTKDAMILNTAILINNPTNEHWRMLLYMSIVLTFISVFINLILIVSNSE